LLVAVLPVGRIAVPTGSVTPAGTISSLAPVAIAPLPPATLASTVPAIVVAATTTSSGQLAGHQWLVATRPDDLEGLGLASISLTLEDRRDLNPVHELVHLDAKDIADHRAVGYQVSPNGTLRLPGTLGAPCPVAVVSSARQLDLHAWHGQER
tara:strand:+ start:219 stop:677 length:459 start_codon:yes stop_codon:yes gene_type:complete